MRETIERLITDFERGGLSRRQLATALVGLCAMRANAAPNGSDLTAVSVNHVTLRVPDVERSTKFYQELFGLQMRKASPTVKILSLNDNCFFGIEAANGKGPAVDHFALGIRNFKVDEVVAKLKKRNLTLSGVSKEGLKLADPDGILVQLNAPDYPGYLPAK
jgi:catechol 2,3-dioxygenase-like lactoylglutathione lyase family enzyme